MGERKPPPPGTVAMFDTDPLVVEKPSRESRAYLVAKTWKERPETTARLRGDFRAMERAWKDAGQDGTWLDAERVKFLDYCHANNQKWVKWEQAFGNWLRTAAGRRVSRQVQFARDHRPSVRATYNPAEDFGA